MIDMTSTTELLKAIEMKMITTDLRLPPRADSASRALVAIVLHERSLLNVSGSSLHETNKVSSEFKELITVLLTVNLDPCTSDFVVNMNWVGLVEDALVKALPSYTALPDTIDGCPDFTALEYSDAILFLIRYTYCMVFDDYDDDEEVFFVGFEGPDYVVKNPNEILKRVHVLELIDKAFVFCHPFNLGK